MECIECYSLDNRATPLLNPKDCLENHKQYICGTCGRCICIEKDKIQQLQRWNFPFKTLTIAKLYLRAANYTTQKSCGIYEINNNGRTSYKIFQNNKEFLAYLKKTKKVPSCFTSLFQKEKYESFDKAEVRKLTPLEVKNYLGEL